MLQTYLIFIFSVFWYKYESRNNLTVSAQTVSLYSMLSDCHCKWTLTIKELHEGQVQSPLEHPPYPWGTGTGTVGFYY